MIMPRPTILQLHFVNRNGLFRNNINNNDLRNPLVHMRDHLFHTAFVRLALLYSRLFTETERKFIEFVSLIVSFLALVILMYIHFAFVRTPTNCLESIQDRWPQDGILRVEVFQNKPVGEYTLERSYLKERSLRRYSYDDITYLFLNDPLFREDVHRASVRSYGYTKEKKHVNSQNNSVEENYTSNFSESDISNNNSSDVTSAKQKFIPTSEERAYAWPDDEYIMEFSLEYGFLKLSPTVRKNLNITVELVTLDPTVDKCFGGYFNRFILNNFLGYDEVMLASLKLLAAKEEYKGYVRNVVTEVEFIFVNVWMDRKSYLTAGFVMMVFTVSISILLRYSHHQIFVFIVELLHMLEFHSTLNFPAGPLLTVILALVGMEAIMSEFFNDTAIAFYVILIVWMADQYDAICCRTALSKRHWLRFFYLYHFFFYAYSYRFGHSRFLALLTSWLFTLHSMIYFFHRYELPALVAANSQNGNDPPPFRQGPPDDADLMPIQEELDIAPNLPDGANVQRASDVSESPGLVSDSNTNYSSGGNDMVRQFKFVATNLKTLLHFASASACSKSLEEIECLKIFTNRETFQVNDYYESKKMFHNELQIVHANKISRVLKYIYLFLDINKKVGLLNEIDKQKNVSTYETRIFSAKDFNLFFIENLFLAVFLHLLHSQINFNLKDQNNSAQIFAEKVLLLRMYDFRKYFEVKRSDFKSLMIHRLSLLNDTRLVS